MTCLDLQTKIALMIDQLQVINRELGREDLRPDVRRRMEEESDILKADIRGLYIELLKIQTN